MGARDLLFFEKKGSAFTSQYYGLAIAFQIPFLRVFLEGEK